MDLADLRRAVELGGFHDRHVGFLAQQALEKTLKAWLAAIAGAFPHAHSLGRLLDLLQEAGVEVRQWHDVVDYTTFAVEQRYADPLDDPDQLPLDQRTALSRTTSPSWSNCCATRARWLSRGPRWRTPSGSTSTSTRWSRRCPSDSARAGRGRPRSQGYAPAFHGTRAGCWNGPAASWVMAASERCSKANTHMPRRPAARAIWTWRTRRWGWSGNL